MTYENCLNPDCRRPLTSAKSRSRGFGSGCWRKRRPVPIGAIIPKLPIARRAAEITDGQLEITLEGEET